MALALNNPRSLTCLLCMPVIVILFLYKIYNFLTVHYFFRSFSVTWRVIGSCLIHLPKIVPRVSANNINLNTQDLVISLIMSKTWQISMVNTSTLMSTSGMTSTLSTTRSCQQIKEMEKRCHSLSTDLDSGMNLSVARDIIKSCQETQEQLNPDVFQTLDQGKEILRNVSSAALDTQVTSLANGWGHLHSFTSELSQR